MHYDLLKLVTRNCAFAGVTKVSLIQQKFVITTLILMGARGGAVG
jgi:hypothetical protein